MRPTKTFDANLELKDAGAITASAAGQVDAENQILDLGSGTFEGDVVIDVSACEVDSDDEKYIISMQISDQSDFGSDINDIVSIELGSAGTAAGDNLRGDTDLSTGRYRLPFINQTSDGTTKRYARIYCTISGTIATGINYTAYIAKKAA